MNDIYLIASIIYNMKQVEVIISLWMETNSWDLGDVTLNPRVSSTERKRSKTRSITPLQQSFIHGSIIPKFISYPKKFLCQFLCHHIIRLFKTSTPRPLLLQLPPAIPNSLHNSTQTITRSCWSLLQEAAVKDSVLRFCFLVYIFLQ